MRPNRTHAGRDAALSHREAQSLFGALADEELAPPAQRELETHLEDCTDCRAGWQAYSATVLRVRRVERERAPPALSSLIMRRVRKQRSARLRAAAHHHLLTTYRVPIEAAIPMLIGALVAAFLVFAAP